jgi:hypothetical protein
LTYLNSRDITAIASSAAVWAIINAWLSPIFWQLTHLPFLCDILAFSSLILVVWWTKKFGAASLTGLLVTLITLVLRPGAFQMVGFLAASIVFDVITKAIGYETLFTGKRKNEIPFIPISMISSALGGVIISILVMNQKTFTAIISFASLHVIGGIIGAIIGIILVNSLIVRSVKPTLESELKVKNLQ